MRTTPRHRGPDPASGPPTAHRCPAGSSLVRPEVDLTHHVVLTLRDDLLHDLGEGVVVRGTEQELLEVSFGARQPAIFVDADHDRDLLPVPGDGLRPLVPDRPQHLAEELLSILFLPA